jgi:HSP20 family molecular chaperone IbpA
LFGRLEGLGEGMFTPPVDIKEDADAYTVHLEVPASRRIICTFPCRTTC